MGTGSLGSDLTRGLARVTGSPPAIATKRDRPPGLPDAESVLFAFALEPILNQMIRDPAREVKKITRKRRVERRDAGRPKMHLAQRRPQAKIVLLLRESCLWRGAGLRCTRGSSMIVPEDEYVAEPAEVGGVFALSFSSRSN
jgi:hypothetical protein